MSAWAREGWDTRIINPSEKELHDPLRDIADIAKRIIIDWLANREETDYRLFLTLKLDLSALISLIYSKDFSKE